MSFIDRVKNAWQERQRQKDVERRAEKMLAEGFVAPYGSLSDILANPHKYNRATRRRFGYRLPVGIVPKVLRESLTLVQDPAGQVPRYARRHYEALTAKPRTRRVRRHAARVMRSLEGTGIGV